MILNIKSKISEKSYTVSYEGQYLKSIYTSDEFTAEQWSGMLSIHKPYIWKPLTEWRKFKNVVITEIILEINFEDFWNKYNFKRDRVNAEKEWNKLNEEERSKAYNYISRYKSNLGTTAMVYACRYLKYKRWDDQH